MTELLHRWLKYWSGLNVDEVNYHNSSLDKLLMNKVYHGP